MGTGEGNTNTNFDPVTHFNRDQREVKFLILKGYTTSAKNTLNPQRDSSVDYLRKFFAKLKDNDIFKPEYRLYTNEKVGNLTGFYIILELKETIRK